MKWDLKRSRMMDFNQSLAVFLFVCFQVFNCSDGKKSSNVLNVLTYNLALHESQEPWYSTREARRQRIIRALKKSDADLICLQEVYFGEDVEDIVDNLGKQFPYTFSELHTAVNKFPPQAGKKQTPPCDYTILSSYIKCLKASSCQPTNITCITTMCPAEVADIFKNEGQKCFTCIAMSMLNVQECGAENPVVGGRQMNTGGLVLLSKRKLDKASFIDYHPTTRESFYRGYIKAEVRNFAALRCTHLMTTTFPYFFEPELPSVGINSLVDQNTRQIRSLIKSLKNEKRALILGDFNAGLAFKPNQVALMPENYIELLKKFTTSPAIGYTYKSVEDESNKKVIDHVFVRNLIIGETKRLYVQKDENVPMSDHVGVQSVVTRAC